MRYCARPFTSSDIELIRALLDASPPLNRARLSREVCERLNWRRADGGLKDMSCRVALLRMQADGLITLPPPRNAKPVTYRAHPDIERTVLEPTSLPAVDLARLTVDLVGAKRDSLLWNAYIQRHHYLGSSTHAWSATALLRARRGPRRCAAELRRKRLENQTAR